MSRKLAPWLIALAAAALAAATAAPASAAPIIDPLPIGPRQHFEGLVNGQPDQAIIRTDCLGPTPIVPRFGHPLPGQTVSASFSPTSDGFTGETAHSINVNIFWPESPLVSVAVLRAYVTPAPIPTSVTVPCSGPGQVMFAPNPNDDAVTETVNVTFEPCAPCVTKPVS